MTLTLSVHQPAYLPWLGYFDKIARADLFVVLDTVQFEKRGYIHRNRIKTPQGAHWLTIPVKSKGHRSATLQVTKIDNSQPWRRRHLKAIALNYRRAPYFEMCFPKLETLLSGTESGLAELCFRQLHFWLGELGISTRVVRSSDLPAMGAKSDLILDLCRHVGAKRYLSGQLGRDYLVECDFRAAGITIEYQEYAHPVYPQQWGSFLPAMSIVDYWMNCGSRPLTPKERPE